ncbi:hypothetical protein AAFF_G00345870 [Aldrovandia affinis]|uniref:Uncharacterized protein n=1 Tax=Aldrovandia affinis TaxID=143900 RepID=A0AAD7SJI5_9TELE|nr:hypothetical protein AAFF_G00345870 [Aldrovandia affinis]
MLDRKYTISHRKWMIFSLGCIDCTVMLLEMISPSLCVTKTLSVLYIQYIDEHVTCASVTSYYNFETNVVLCLSVSLSLSLCLSVSLSLSLL